MTLLVGLFMIAHMFSNFIIYLNELSWTKQISTPSISEFNSLRNVIPYTLGTAVVYSNLIPYKKLNDIRRQKAPTIDIWDHRADKAVNQLIVSRSPSETYENHDRKAQSRWPVNQLILSNSIRHIWMLWKRIFSDWQQK